MWQLRNELTEFWSENYSTYHLPFLPQYQWKLLIGNKKNPKVPKIISPFRRDDGSEEEKAIFSANHLESTFSPRI